MLLIGALLVVAGVALTLLPGEQETTGSGETPAMAAWVDDRPSLIILSCANISPNPEDAYLADGLHEEILHRLAGVSGIALLGRETSRWYRENPIPPDEIAAERQLDFVGECSVRKARNDDRILVTFQLLNAAGVHEWSEEYEGDFAANDLFDMQRDIAERVSSAIGATLTAEDQERINATPTENTEALNAYLLGRHFLNRRTEANGVENIRTARRYFEEALDADSSYASAWSGLSDALVCGSQSASLEVPKAEILERAEHASRQAVFLDPSLPEGHTSLAFALDEKWEWIEAEQEFQRSIALSPGYTAAHHWYATFLVGQGRVDEALREIRQAQRLDPISPIIGVWVGLILDAAGRTAEAGEQYRALLEIHPGEPRVLRELTAHSLRSGDFEQAADYLEVLFEDVEGIEHWSEGLRTPETRAATLRELVALEGAGLIYGPDMAVVAGDKALALEVLEHWSTEPGMFHPSNLAVFVLSPELRSEPLFHQMLEEMGVSW
jgi:serine/threonine-protein kinase